jgi:hypothetical protein
MTEQLTLDELCDLGAEQLHEPADEPHRDLRGQGLTAIQLHTITDIRPVGDYL